MGLRIGIDLDGVVADFNRGWTSAWNAQHGTALSVDDVVGWDVLPRLTGLDDMRAFWAWARDLGDGRSLFRDLPTFDGAIEAIRSLVADGHEPVVLTAKPGWSIHDTFAWLADVRFPTREVHIIDAKWRVECDVYIDDAPHVLTDYVRHRSERTICRFVRPWNDEVPGTIATASWDEVLEVVGEVAAARTRGGVVVR